MELTKIFNINNGDLHFSDIKQSLDIGFDALIGPFQRPADWLGTEWYKKLHDSGYLAFSSYDKTDGNIYLEVINDAEELF